MAASSHTSCTEHSGVNAKLYIIMAMASGILLLLLKISVDMSTSNANIATLIKQQDLNTLHIDQHSEELSEHDKRIDRLEQRANGG